jgi:hypothetical protein
MVRLNSTVLAWQASVKASEGSGGVEESKGNDGDAMVVDEPATQR